MSFGKKLRKIRREKDISQKVLGKKVGVYYTYISKYEKGHIMPSADVLRKLAIALNVSLDYLLLDNSTAPVNSHIADKELLKQFEQVEKLPEEDKATIKKFLDAFLTKKQVHKSIK